MTEGTNVYQMFQTSSGSLNKIWQTKFWSGDGMEITKQMLRIFHTIQPQTGTVSIASTLESVVENTNTTNTITITPAGGAIISGVGSINLNTRANYFGMTNKMTTQDFVIVHESVVYRNESPLGA